jgi:hypothetical protein
MPGQQDAILCTVAIASAFGYKLEDLRAFATVARGCVKLSNVEKYGRWTLPLSVADIG